jgi:hypothetical protein
MFVYGLVTGSGAVAVTITAARMTNAGVAGISCKGWLGGFKTEAVPQILESPHFSTFNYNQSSERDEQRR